MVKKDETNLSVSPTRVKNRVLDSPIKELGSTTTPDK